MTITQATIPKAHWWRWGFSPGSGNARARVAVALLGAPLLLAAAPYQPVGGDFPLVTAQAGDQITPALGIGKDGRGYVVWSDNTDGSGSGIGGQAYSRNGIRTGQSFRINATTQGDQSQPALAVLADGSTFVAWQSGSQGSSAIYGRLIGADGILRDEVRISDADKDVRTVSVAASPSGGAIVVWSQLGADAADFGIVSRLIGANGVPTEPARLVNSYSSGNQRGSAVAALTGGGYVAVWTSEGQTGGENVDIIARKIGANGAATGVEVVVSRAKSLNQSPTIQGLANGGFAVAWCSLGGLAAPTAGGAAAASATVTLNQLVDDVSKVVWGVYARAYDASASPTTAEVAVSNQPDNSQLKPSLSANEDAIAVSWSGSGLDGSGTGIGGRVLSLGLVPLSDVVIVNERRRGDQETPTIISDGPGSFLAVWSNWQGLDSGMDLVAHRFQRIENLLAAPPAPIVEAKSAWQVRAVWAPVLGLPLSQYEVSFDGGAPVAVTEPIADSGDYFPSTSHTIKYRYVLSDGRTSPYSDSVTVVTWGKDQNLDGLPDDWQAQYFGATPKLWPAPTVDSDGDGVSDRDEFLAGTDPLNPGDALRVTLSQGFGGRQVSWNAKLGATYRVQSSSDLAQWLDLTRPVFAAEASPFITVSETNGALYFRVLRLR